MLNAEGVAIQSSYVRNFVLVMAHPRVVKFGWMAHHVILPIPKVAVVVSA